MKKVLWLAVGIVVLVTANGFGQSVSMADGGGGEGNAPLVTYLGPCVAIDDGSSTAVIWHWWDYERVYTSVSAQTGAVTFGEYTIVPDGPGLSGGNVYKNEQFIGHIDGSAGTIASVFGVPLSEPSGDHHPDMNIALDLYWAYQAGWASKRCNESTFIGFAAAGVLIGEGLTLVRIPNGVNVIKFEAAWAAYLVAYGNNVQQCR